MQEEDADLDVLGELLIVFFVVVLVLGKFSEKLQALLHQVLADDLQDLALLQRLSGDVQGQILGVHHTLNEIWWDRIYLLEKIISADYLIYEQSAQAISDSSLGLILTEILRDELIAVVHDEDPAHVQFNVVLFLLVLKEIEWGAARHKEQGPEFQLTLYWEVLWAKSVEIPVSFHIS